MDYAYSGLYLSIPYTPNDAYHLLRAALKINNPTIFIEHKLLYNTSGVLDKNNPDQIFGKAQIQKKGKDFYNQLFKNGKFC